MVAVMYLVRVTERAVVMMVMIGVAVMPVPIMCPTRVNVPPARIVTPVPRTMPCVPCVTPEPIIYQRSMYIYGLKDISCAIYILIADNLNRNLIFLVFLYVYRGYILIDVLSENSL